MTKADCSTIKEMNVKKKSTYKYLKTLAYNTSIIKVEVRY